jgi:23S rRNA (uracil1939-C5)-methyltransferase
MKIRRDDIVELWIGDMAFGGKGIARLDGLVLFVKGAIPGDRVLAQVIKKKKDYANAVLVKLLDPSPDRIQAPCPYSAYCGGCQWQHILYKQQLAYKREHVQEAMARIGMLPDILVHEVIASDNIFEYRNKMEFSFSDHCWVLPDAYEKGHGSSGFGLGLHVPGTFHKVIDVDACLLQHRTGNTILQEVREYTRDSGVPAYGLKSHQGFWRFLTLRYSRAFDEWMVNLVTSEENRDVLEPLAENLHQAIGNIKTVVNTVNTRKAAIASGEREIILMGEGTIQDRIGPFQFQISANSFFQTNTGGAERLYQTIREYAGLSGKETVLDLYSGTGTIPIFLSKGAKDVMGMELSQSAVADAVQNCETNQISNCRFIAGDIKEKISALGLRPDVMVIDPPRVGMHKDVLTAVMQLAPDKIVYVSCNPTTMARDMGQMAQEYHIKEVQPVDMFPHTYHIESVAKMVRKSWTQ